MPLTTASNRYLFPPTTAATLNMAAVAAQCARIWKTIDPGFSSQCLTAAETAFAAAQADPTDYAASFPAGGGDYGDNNVTDEFYWAASELYLSTGKDVYKNFILASPDWAQGEVPDWGDTAALGTIDLATIPNGLPSDKIQACRSAITAAADLRLGFINRQGYRVPVANFVWGSNSEVLNAAMIMGYAYQFTGETKYLDGVTESMDYILGSNAMNKSYVTGYGTNPVAHPQHRFWANQPKNGYPAPPPGVLSGGPNGDIPVGDVTAIGAGLASAPAEKSYMDNLNSFSTNEVAINWNAPLAWVTAFIGEPHKGGTVAPPAAPAPKNDQGIPAWLFVFVPAVLVVAGGTVFWIWRKGRKVGV
jgi:endoglucanase